MNKLYAIYCYCITLLLLENVSQAQAPTLLKNILSGAGNGIEVNVRENFVQKNGTVFFAANEGTNGFELWKTDGTNAGTVIVKDINNGATSSQPSHFVNIAGTIFFTADNGANGFELWKTDGTNAGTVIVKDINTTAAESSYPNQFIVIDKTLYFVATDNVNGTELWKTDGTNAGTTIVKDINSGVASSEPQSLYKFGNEIYFSANDGTNGFELWKTDGTNAGTVMVKNISTDPSGSSVHNFAALGNILLFTANDGNNGFELWKTDGTNAGTVMLLDINPTAWQYGSEIHNFTIVGTTAYFTAFKDGDGFELWKTDGTSTGTAMVKNINSNANASSYPNHLIEYQNKLFFSANDGNNGYELYSSDGTNTGTTILKNINSGSSSSALKYPIVLNNVLYFTATSANGNELWKTDGTSAGTVELADINTSSASSNIKEITNCNGSLYFEATTSVLGAELYKYNPCTNLSLPTATTSTLSFNPAVYTNVTNNNCDLLATIQQTGTQPLYNSINIKVTKPVSVQSFANIAYVAKYVDVEPSSNAANATAKVTLYYTQAEFNAYNAANAAINGDLPTEPTDAIGKQSVRVIQFHGTGTNPTNYTGPTEEITPDPSNIVWNSTDNRWEITVDVTGFSGFYLRGPLVSIPLYELELKAQKNNTGIQLTWINNTPANNNYTIMRSINGIDFVDIALVTNTLFTDVNVTVNNDYWYKVKNIVNNQVYFSNTVKIPSNTNNSLRVEPTISNTVINVYGLSNEPTYITILNTQGAIVMRGMYSNYNNVINIMGLPSGTYQLITNRNSFVRFIKQ
jgi:ELWxxDGT repeat protein